MIFSECCSAQPVAAQVLQAGGEREGGRVDRGRCGVPQKEEPQGKQPVDKVCGPFFGRGGGDGPLYIVCKSESYETDYGKNI